MIAKSYVPYLPMILILPTHSRFTSLLHTSGLHHYHRIPSPRYRHLRESVVTITPLGGTDRGLGSSSRPRIEGEEPGVEPEETT
jgi:hypothetical protein